VFYYITEIINMDILSMTKLDILTLQVYLLSLFDFKAQSP
jgi:hypothetical protein